MSAIGGRTDSGRGGVELVGTGKQGDSLEVAGPCDTGVSPKAPSEASRQVSLSNSRSPDSGIEPIPGEPRDLRKNPGSLKKGGYLSRKLIVEATPSHATDTVQERGLVQIG